MFTNNPYAQGGWSNPANPHSINNGPWGSQSPPQPSVYGALPHAVAATPPTIIAFHFVGLSPSVLDCSVVGPQGRRYYSVATGPGAGAGAATLVCDPEGRSAGVVEWHQQPTVEVRGAGARRVAAQWMGLSPDRSYRTMEFRGKWYAWVPREGVISLFTVGPTPPELLAKVSRERDSVKLEITAQAVQAGLLDAAVLAVVLLHSGRNFG